MGTFLGVFVAIAAVIINARSQRENDRLQREHYQHVKDNDKVNLQMRGLDLVFEKMNNDRKRLAREKLLIAYYNYLKINNKPTEYGPNNYKDHPIVDLVDFDPKVRPYLESVKSDFSQIAVMVKHGLIDEEAYLDAFWGSMLRCYFALHGNIEAMRDKSGTKHYTTKFQEQCEERAVKYWQDKHPTSKIIYYSYEPNSDK